MKQYWENIWDNSTITEHMGYVYGLGEIDSNFIETFQSHHIHSVCDAACGFGKYSALLCANGFLVSGFDIAESSIHLTKQILHFLGMDSITSNYTIADIVHTPYINDQFDAVVAHDVMDHLPAKDVKLAIKEMMRIIRKDGLLYLSFGGNNHDLESYHAKDSKQEDENKQSLNRDGYLYHFYNDEELKKGLLHDYHILQFTTEKHGDREIILQK